MIKKSPVLSGSLTREQGHMNMVKKNILFSSAIGLCIGLGILTGPLATPVYAHIPLADIAQGDGDPTENIADIAIDEDVSETKNDADMENIAMITAEGDFLLPTYLLPTEQTEQPQNTDKKDEQTDRKISETQTVVTKTKTTTTTTTNSQQLPVYVVSKTTSENVALQEPSHPIADVPETKTVVEAQDDAIISETDEDTTIAISSDTVKAAKQEKKPILIPLAPLPTSDTTELALEKPTRKIVPSKYADNVLNAVSNNEPTEFIMPQEIRVSFYKNADNFSGQTLKWVKAFSTKVLNDPRLMVQVRVSKKSPKLQMRRLSVIKNALIGAGLSTHQMQFVASDRDVDSLVLRTIMKPENAYTIHQSQTKKRKSSPAQTKW